MPTAEYPQAVTNLILEFKRLPGIGPRSAERIAVWLLQHAKANPLPLAEAIQIAHQNIAPCDRCGFFSQENQCPICDDERRDPSQLCIVEQATDILPIERAGAFHGFYHCLGGKLSPLDQIAPEDLRIHQLEERLRQATPAPELILALGADVEGEATAHYLAQRLRSITPKITRIAQGLPAGGGLEHADALTILRALQGRVGF